MQQGLTCPRKAERAFCHLFQSKMNAHCYAGSNFLAKRWNCPYRLNDKNPRDSSRSFALCKESRQNSAKEREVSCLVLLWCRTPEITSAAPPDSRMREWFGVSERRVIHDGYIRMNQNERGVWGILTPSHPWRLYQDEPEWESGLGYLNAESPMTVISGWTGMREIWVQNTLFLSFSHRNSIFVTRTAS